MKYITGLGYLACHRLLQFHLARSLHVAAVTCVNQTSTKTDYFNSNKLHDQVHPDDYEILGLDMDCTEEEVKKAFLMKAKLYHPDSGQAEADDVKFTQVQQAYRNIQKQFRIAEEEADNSPVAVEFDIKHTAPQHRQYLSMDGVGYGTPHQRHRQYEQYRVDRVTESLYEHRSQKMAAQYEEALVVKEKQAMNQAMRKHKISSPIDQLVNDLINEAIANGEFNNLSGAGKPLNYQNRNPLLDSATYNLNKVLINSGYAPEWIRLGSEIRSSIKMAREKLAKEREKHVLESSSNSLRADKQWNYCTEQFTLTVAEINVQIHRFNLQVPLLEKQMFEYNPTREVLRISEDYEEYLDKDSAGNSSISSENVEQSSTFSNLKEKIDWAEIWSDFKAIFKHR